MRCCVRWPATLGQLVAARALQGIGGARTGYGDGAGGDRRRGEPAGAWALSGLYGVDLGPLASVAGPIIGGWVTDALSWRWILWINLPAGAGGDAVVRSNWRLRSAIRARASGRGSSWVGKAGLLTASVSAWLLVLSNRVAWKCRLALSRPSLALSAGGLVLLVLLARQERRFPDPTAAAAPVQQSGVHAWGDGGVLRVLWRCSAAASCCRCSFSWCAEPRGVSGALVVYHSWP